MIPQTGKIYYIDYNSKNPEDAKRLYHGIAIFTGKIEKELFNNSDLFEFHLGNYQKTLNFCYFAEEDIIEEVKE